MKLRPIVTYQCVIDGCGLRLAALVLSDGHPTFGIWVRNSAKRMIPGIPGSSWKELFHLDDPEVLVQVDEFGCRHHGSWYLTGTEMLHHWDEARRSRRLTIHLDESGARGWDAPRREPPD